MWWWCWVPEPSLDSRSWCWHWNSLSGRNSSLCVIAFIDTEVKLSWDLTAILNFIGSEHLTRDVFPPVPFGKGEHENFINYWAYRESSHEFCFAWLYLLSQLSKHFLLTWLVSGSFLGPEWKTDAACDYSIGPGGETWGSPESLLEMQSLRPLQTYWHRPAFSQVPGY